jgi:hypothetical protein
MIHSYTFTAYTCPQWLRRKGLLCDGGDIPEPLSVFDRSLTVAEIQQAVSEHYHLPIEEMTSARRAREVARPRQVAMYLSKQLTPRSLPEIGRRFGWRDHTTVMHAIKQVEKLAAADPEFRENVIAILERLEPLVRSPWPWLARRAA